MVISWFQLTNVKRAAFARRSDVMGRDRWFILLRVLTASSGLMLIGLIAYRAKGHWDKFEALGHQCAYLNSLVFFGWLAVAAAVLFSSGRWVSVVNGVVGAVFVILLVLWLSGWLMLLRLS